MGRRLLVVLAAAAACAAAECRAIEMFTFFGDGSRVGLPSLEVPVEAYPGIPLRSDRIRARRRAARGAPPAARAAQAGLPAGVTLRAVPAGGAVRIAPGPPIPPEPDDVLRPGRPNPR